MNQERLRDIGVTVGALLTVEDKRLIAEEAEKHGVSVAKFLPKAARIVRELGSLNEGEITYLRQMLHIKEEALRTIGVNRDNAFSIADRAVAMCAHLMAEREAK